MHFFWLRVDLTVPLSVCVSPCVCAKNWRSILSLINIQILQLRGVNSCAKHQHVYLQKDQRKTDYTLFCDGGNSEIQDWEDMLIQLRDLRFLASHECTQCSCDMHNTSFDPDHDQKSLSTLANWTKKQQWRDRWRALLEATSLKRCWDWCKHAHKHVDLALSSRPANSVM